MNQVVLNALVSTGGSAGLIALVWICYTLIKKFKKNNDSNQNSNTNTNNINIQSNQKDQVISLLNDIIKENKETLKVLTKDINNVNNKLSNLSTALNYYVDNNGVKPEVKENFKKLLNLKKGEW